MVDSDSVEITMDADVDANLPLIMNDVVGCLEASNEASFFI